jgi:hypothetical protein
VRVDKGRALAAGTGPTQTGATFVARALSGFRRPASRILLDPARHSPLLIAPTYACPAIYGASAAASELLATPISNNTRMMDAICDPKNDVPLCGCFPSRPFRLE